MAVQHFSADGFWINQGEDYSVSLHTCKQFEEWVKDGDVVRAWLMCPEPMKELWNGYRPEGLYPDDLGAFEFGNYAEAYEYFMTNQWLEHLEEREPLNFWEMSENELQKYFIRNRDLMITGPRFEVRNEGEWKNNFYKNPENFDSFVNFDRFHRRALVPSLQYLRH